MVQETREERTTGGRRLITVSEDYDSLPNLSLVVQNVGHVPAKSFSFSFSAQVEGSDGFVLSDLATFQEGLTDLAPGAKILCYWGKFENLLPMIQDGRLERQISVTVEYQDLTRGYHSNEWAIAPWRYEGLRTTEYKGMTDLVNAVEELIEDVFGEKRGSGRYPRTPKMTADVTADHRYARCKIYASDRDRPPAPSGDRGSGGGAFLRKHGPPGTSRGSFAPSAITGSHSG